MKKPVVLQGDVVEVLSTFPANTFHGCLTDPPYGLRFMSKSWDKVVPGVETWREVLRVLKPGAKLLAFSSPRTQHRLACAIEDAGFEITDCIMWIFGSGFPKSKTCLKPAYEPIILARKRGPMLPLAIDASRIGTNETLGRLNHSTSTFNAKNTTPLVDNSPRPRPLARERPARRRRRTGARLFNGITL